MSKGTKMPDTMTIVTRERDVPIAPDSNVVYQPAPDLSTNYLIPIPADDADSESATDH